MQTAALATRSRPRRQRRDDGAMQVKERPRCRACGRRGRNAQQARRAGEARAGGGRGWASRPKGSMWGGREGRQISIVCKGHG